MDGYKLASFAGIVTMAASVCVQNSVSCLTQVGQTGQPGVQEPAQPGAAAKPAQPGMDARTKVSDKSMFQLCDPGHERKLSELAAELARIEKEMENSNQRLMRQLSQVRLLDGERKTDALAEIMQGMLEDHVQLHSYLSDLREAITGKVESSMTALLPSIEPAEDVDKDKDKEDKEEEKPDLTPRPGSPHLPPR